MIIIKAEKNLLVAISFLAMVDFVFLAIYHTNFNLTGDFRSDDRYKLYLQEISLAYFDGDNKAMNNLMDISENFSRSECCPGCDTGNDAMQTI